MDNSPKQRIQFGDRWATVMHVDEKWKPVPPDKAKIAVALFDDGGKSIFFVK